MALLWFLLSRCRHRRYRDPRAQTVASWTRRLGWQRKVKQKVSWQGELPPLIVPDLFQEDVFPIKGRYVV